MELRSTFPVIIFLSMVALIEGEARVAVAHLSAQNIRGTIYFRETDRGVRVHGSITGLKPGLYGFHVHEFGDTSRACNATGGHFDPHGRHHGGKLHEVRHVGDFGNVRFIGTNENAVAVVDFVDRLVTLRGQNNILGRGLVLHEHEDDLGLGGHPASLITGNAGPRIACGTIGIQSGYWSSGITTSSSLILIIFGIIFVHLNEI